MSSRKLSPGRVALLLLLLAQFAMLCSLAAAQESAPRVDIFGGYSWLNPGGKVAIGPAPAGGTLANALSAKIPGISKGWGADATWNFNKWVGLTADFSGHYSDPADVHTILFGPRVAFRSEHFTPFVHGLVGIARLSPAGLDSHTGFGAAVGGGIDMFFTNHFAIRVIEADYLRQDHAAKNVGGDGSFDGARLQGGLVIGLGSLKPPVAPTASCSAQPASMLAGEPVTATVNAQNFNPKHTLAYDWKSTGGKLTAKNTTASIDTAGLAPGPYTITATVTDAKAHKNYNTANCKASFTINEPPKHPPTITCSASPATVRSGDSATITAQAGNPDNRPLTYSWNASGGRITGSGASVTLDTAGAAAGPINIKGTVTDDRGLSADCSTSVSVEVPPPPPQASKIGEIAFPNKKKPARVDNTAKAILDDVALRLQREADAKAVVIGYFDPAEKGGNEKLAQQRAVNTKAYLTDEKGIDPSRIEVRTGTAGGTRAEIYLVPPGATFNVQGTQAFSEAEVKKPVVKKKPAPKSVKKAPAAPAAAPKP